MKRNMKLYVWEHVLTDYTSGVMFALATSVEGARQTIIEDCEGIIVKDLESEPEVYTSVKGFAVWGGG